MLPVPRYVVFYNGQAEKPERQILKLSDSFPECGPIERTLEQDVCSQENSPLPPVALECRALMLNINYGKNRELMNRCKPLLDYSRFIQRIRKNIQDGHSPEDAVKLAVEYCLANGILTDILRAHRKEVVGMFLEDYDAELHDRTLRKEGYEDGERSVLEKMVKKKLAKGKSIEVIAEEMEETVQFIKKIIEDMTQETIDV